MLTQFHRDTRRGEWGPDAAEWPLPPKLCVAFGFAEHEGNELASAVRPVTIQAAAEALIFLDIERCGQAVVGRKTEVEK